VVEQEAKERAKGDALSRLLHVASAYRETLERALRDRCTSLLQLLDTNLLRNTTSTSHSRAFYLKLKADYHRYQAEFECGADRKEAAGNALRAYKSAASEAERSVPATDPIRLGIALNQAVFYFEILKSIDRAVDVAQNAFDDGIADLSDITNDQKQKSMATLQLLRDNLTIWTAIQERRG
jgi:14-3-3 protein epsilon